MRRREFIKTAGFASLASALGDVLGSSQPVSPNVGSLFEANSADVLALAERIMDRCVLDK